MVGHVTRAQVLGERGDLLPCVSTPSTVDEGTFLITSFYLTPLLLDLFFSLSIKMGGGGTTVKQQS